jgi:NADH:ubiquinone oxidoreductase subunit K
VVLVDAETLGGVGVVQILKRKGFVEMILCKEMMLGELG